MSHGVPAGIAIVHAAVMIGIFVALSGTHASVDGRRIAHVCVEAKKKGGHPKEITSFRSTPPAPHVLLYASTLAMPVSRCAGRWHVLPAFTRVWRNRREEKAAMAENSRDDEFFLRK